MYRIDYKLKKGLQEMTLFHFWVFYSNDLQTILHRNCCISIFEIFQIFCYILRGNFLPSTTQCLKWQILGSIIKCRFLMICIWNRMIKLEHKDNNCITMDSHQRRKCDTKSPHLHSPTSIHSHCRLTQRQQKQRLWQQMILRQCYIDRLSLTLH